MKVAFVYPAYWPYIRRGNERLMHDLATYLVEHGHSVDIITAKPGPGRTEQTDGLTVQYLPLHQHPLTMAYQPGLRFYRFGIASLGPLLRKDYDVLHVWSFSFALGAPILRRLRGTPYLFHVIVDEPGWPRGVDRWIYERLLLGADQVATLTASGAQYMHERYGRQATVLPPPVDTRVFQPCGEKDLSRPRVLFPGDLGDPRKGGFLLLRAWNEIHRRNPDAVLQLAGPFGFAGSDIARVFLDTIPALVRDPAARTAIDVLGAGAVADLPRLYAEAAVTVLPSVHEAFGMVVTESLACGTPVVCSDSAGPGEIVGGDTSIGQTVPLREMHDLSAARSVGVLAEAVVRAVDLARQPGTVDRCRARAMRWSLDRVGEQTEAVYTNLTTRFSLRSQEGTSARTV